MDGLDPIRSEKLHFLASLHSSVNLFLLDIHSHQQHFQPVFREQTFSSVFFLRTFTPFFFRRRLEHPDPTCPRHSTITVLVCHTACSKANARNVEDRMCSGAGDGERNGHNKTDQETGTSSRRLAWERTKRRRAQDTESDVELHQKRRESQSESLWSGETEDGPRERWKGRTRHGGEG